MDIVERELLEAIAHDRDDRAALSVLADYWIERVDETRGAVLQLACQGTPVPPPVAAQYCAIASAAGFPASHLRLVDGVLRWPLVISAGEPLDEHAELFRLSPRYYRQVALLQSSSDFDVFAGEAVTPMRATNHPRVVIKTLSRYADDESRHLLAREHAILQTIDHPNVISTAGLALCRNGLALVTPWAGISLYALLRIAEQHGRRLGASFAFSVLLQLLDALDTLHRAGIVHREIRSDHVLVAPDGRVTLIDFGYVEAPFPRPAERLMSPNMVANPTLTFRYLSPEQVRAVRLDARTDVFSAMVVACELVENRQLVRNCTNDWDLLLAIRDCAFTLPALPPPLTAVARATLVRRESRIATAAELAIRIRGAAAASNLVLGPDVIAEALCALGVPA